MKGKDTMGQRKTLQPHEIRIIKIDRKAILDLVWEILSEISYEKFQLPHNTYFIKKICIDWCFDEEQCEIFLLAHSKTDTINKNDIINCIKNLSVEAIDSLCLKPYSKRYYHSVLHASAAAGHRAKASCAHGNEWGKLLTNLGLRILPLKKHEVRVIRLSRQAIQELLWEHFMKTGNKVMDIPEDVDDIRTVYHMYVEGNLEELTLYAMNFDEASDKALMENQVFCDLNIHFTTDSYSDESPRGRNYVSVMLSES